MLKRVLGKVRLFDKVVGLMSAKFRQGQWLAATSTQLGLLKANLGLVQIKYLTLTALKLYCNIDIYKLLILSTCSCPSITHLYYRL